MSASNSEDNYKMFDNDIEYALLSAILIYKYQAMQLISTNLKPYHFSDKRNSIIFEIVTDLVNSNSIIDIISIYDEAVKRNVMSQLGGAFRLQNLLENEGVQLSDLEGYVHKIILNN